MHYGYEGAKLIGSGQISGADYHSKYTKSLKSRKNAISNGCYSELLNCITNAVASIESYVSSKANVWNKQHECVEFPVGMTISLETKLNDWLIIMTGHKLNEFDLIWNHFTDYKNLNNSIFKHNPAGSHAASFDEMANIINKFRTGIAEILFQLHRLFNERIPSNIVRGKYLPDVYI